MEAISTGQEASVHDRESASNDCTRKGRSFNVDLPTARNDHLIKLHNAPTVLQTLERIIKAVWKNRSRYSGSVAMVEWLKIQRNSIQ